VALLVGVGMQNVKGARRAAGIIAFILAATFGLAAFLEGPTRTLLGNPPFRVVLPSVFRNVHGDQNSTIASDDPGRNSVQLLSGVLHQQSPDDYLKEKCTNDPAKIAERNEIDDASTVKLSFTPVMVGKGCFMSWHEIGQPLDHYEVYAVYRAGDSAPWQWGRLHLRAEKPSHVLVREDYVRMRDSFFTSAHITPPG
jgi:hypothetical protein